MNEFHSIEAMKFRYLRKALKTENEVVDSKKRILSIKTILNFAK